MAWDTVLLRRSTSHPLRGMALNSNYHYTPLPLHYFTPLFPSPTLLQTLLLLLLLLLLGAVSMATTTRDRSVYKVKLAEQAERYEEMVEFMEQVAVAAASEGEAELSAEERNLLFVAYKNVIGARRASWRIVSSIEQKEEGRGNHAHADAIRAYRTRIESELASICGGILRLHLWRQPPLRRRPRIQGLLPQDAGRLPPLPRRVPDQLRPQGRRRAHPHRLQGRPGYCLGGVAANASDPAKFDYSYAACDF